MVPLGVKVVELAVVSSVLCQSGDSMKSVNETFKGQQRDGFVIYLTTP
jgi:hypothetical protein